MLFSLVSAVAAFSVHKLTGITFNSTGLAPESFAYNPLFHNFILGSVTEGSLTAVDFDGEARTILPRIKEGYGTSGVKIGYNGNIYTCLVDFSKISLATGEPVISDGAQSFIAAYDAFLQPLYVSKLPQKRANFCNDIKVHFDGSLLVTDSASQTVYSVSPKGVVSEFATIPGSNFLDGIEQEDGVILVSDYVNNKLFRIEGGNITEVGGVNTGFDSIYLLKENKLIAVNGGGYYGVTTTDNWKTANVVKHDPVQGPGATGTSFVPIGFGYGAINNAYGFSPTQVSYTIDIVPLP
ncbi:hypothetical protein HDV04_000806 [Boothiomyces sp. JEL0838]|nr:hypothetical protein HDV04_000806 [Boothiomyces sp. JEL0838]